MVVNYLVDEKKTVKLLEKETGMKAVHGFFRVGHYTDDAMWSVFNGDAILTNAHLTYRAILRVKRYGKKITVTGFPEYFSVKPWERDKNGTA